MKILIVTRVKKRTDHGGLWRAMERRYGAECKTFQSFDEKVVFDWLASFDFREFDRVIVHLPFRYLRFRPDLLNSIGNLVIFDQDTYKNFRRSDAFFGEYLRFFERLSRFRLICSSYNVAQEYRRRGIDTRFVSKGFYSVDMRDFGSERDIFLGHVGRLKSQLYADRKRFIDRLKRHREAEVFSDVYGSDYVNLLNRIQIFVSADRGFREYMTKNFEAMACGCVLLANRQGRGEEEALGLVDMENAVLYDELEEAVAKIDRLGGEPELMRTIAARGGVHARERFDPRVKAAEVYDALQDPIGENEYRGRGRARMRLADRLRFLPVERMGRRSLEKLRRTQEALVRYSR